MATKEKNKSAEAQGNYCANCVNERPDGTADWFKNTNGFKFCSIRCRDGFRRTHTSDWFKRMMKGENQISTDSIRDSATGGDAFRFFGVELETLVSRNFDPRGEPARNFTADHDGSISGRGMGVEFKSGILDSKNGGFDKVKGFSEVLSQNATVNTSCGFHLHLFIPRGMRNIQSLKKIFYAYKMSEGFFFSLVSESRRTSGMCRKLRGTVGSILSIGTKKELLREFYDRGNITEDRVKDIGKYGVDRYCWVNLDSVFRNGTIEIRSHQGTTDHRKITMWYRLHARFLKWVERHSIKDIEKFAGKSNAELTEYLKQEIFKQGTLKRYIDERQKKFGTAGTGDDE